MPRIAAAVARAAAADRRVALPLYSHVLCGTHGFLPRVRGVPERGRLLREQPDNLRLPHSPAAAAAAVSNQLCRIIVLHRGKVEEEGTHLELLSHGGLYARLHELQFAAA